MITGNFKPTGEIREPAVGEYFLHSENNNVTRKGPLAVIDDSVFGTTRVIVVERGAYHITVNHETYLRMANHADKLINKAARRNVSSEDRASSGEIHR